jgi:hypothetical protein
MGACSSAARAEIDLGPGFTPSDGALTIEQLDFAQVIDLGQAAGAWDAPSAGKGIYDKDQWAVVFKYSQVAIPPGWQIGFCNHPSRAPVVRLVQGDVTIGGTLDLRGEPQAKPTTRWRCPSRSATPPPTSRWSRSPAPSGPAAESRSS